MTLSISLWYRSPDRIEGNLENAKVIEG